MLVKFKKKNNYVQANSYEWLWGLKTIFYKQLMSHNSTHKRIRWYVVGHPAAYPPLELRFRESDYGGGGGVGLAPAQSSRCKDDRQRNAHKIIF